MSGAKRAASGATQAGSVRYAGCLFTYEHVFIKSGGRYGSVFCSPSGPFFGQTRGIPTTGPAKGADEKQCRGRPRSCALHDVCRCQSTDGSFEFGQLSTGAKQQISVLIRLAMARLIAEERPHPVFLDDALSDTDPDRFESIANILRSVAREMQIIMTTCHHGRHRRLGVTTKRMENLKQRDERTSAPSS